MNIVEIIPISKGVFKGTFSYFTSSNLEEGDIVTVKIKNRETKAMVLSSQNGDSIKSEIKSLAFEMKKIDEIHPVKIFTPCLISAAKKTAEYFAGTTGNILENLIPKIILKKIDEIKINDIVHKNQTLTSPIKSEKLAIQTDYEERMCHYKKLVREEFAKHKSIFICVPTTEDVKKISDELKKGIEKFVIALYANKTAKKTVKDWNNTSSEAHPLLIIGTGLFLGIYRKDLNTIIVERENSNTYKTFSRPFFDIRKFAEFYSQALGIRFIVADTFLRTETLERIQEGEFQELIPLKWRFLSKASEKLVDMKKYNNNNKFKIISDELKKMLLKTRELSENLFIYTTRKGYATQTLCRDCGVFVLCDKCKAPVILYKGGNENKNFFFCHKCRATRSANELCKTCNSWRLQSYGIGIEMIEEQIKELLPNAKIFKIEKNSIKTAKKGREVASEFYATAGAILLGTEMALNYLDSNILNSAVVSIDSLFLIPDFRINEKILNILLKIRSITDSNFIIQTRNPEQKLLNYALSGNLTEFFREEIKERKEYNYPPFSVLIKITIDGYENTIKDDMDKLKTYLGEYAYSFFPTFTHNIKEKYTAHLLIKIARNKWVDKKLLSKLASLPQNILVKIDPDNLF